MDTPQPDTPPPSGLSRRERRERAVEDALRTLVRDLYLERGWTATRGADRLDLRLALSVHPRDNWNLRFEPRLSEQVEPQLEEASARQEAFRPGRVFCFRCDSAGCEHAAPPSAVSVFRGYAETGLPEWQALHQAFVEAHDERVGRLFEGRGDVMALVQLGHGLRERQLSSFGRSSKTYALLGQVVAGYFLLPHPAAAVDPSPRLAMTFQVVEVRDAGGRIGLKLNLLAGLDPSRDLDELFASEWDPWVGRAKELAGRAIGTLERRVQAAREGGRTDEVRAALQRIPLVLRRLAEFIERGHRQGLRRTRHVEQRRQERRPVHKALEDARDAPPDAVFHDEKTGATVVRGPQGRAHVFSEEGRHVTSFTLGPEAVELRLRTQRWRRATPAEARRLGERLRESEQPEP